MKATSIAPANIAFIKYWGQKDKIKFLPYNNSISMNLSDCLTKTTVEFRDDLEEDLIEIAFEAEEFVRILPEQGKASLLFRQIDRVRNLAGISQKVYVKSQNNFPADAGIASSASGFCALTMALCKAVGLDSLLKDEKEFSRLVRVGGSVSAMRSILDGFTESVLDKDDCYTEQLADQAHWGLVDHIAIVSLEKKNVSSTQGHALAETSRHFKERLEELPERINRCKKAILEKDFAQLGECMEEDTLSMHRVMNTSTTSINYWNEGTKQVIEAVEKWRKEGLKAYFTIDAGANVHVICLEADSEQVKRNLEELDKVLRVISNRAAKGAVITKDHLF